MDNAIGKVAAAPAVALHKTLDSSKELIDAVNIHRPLKKARDYWKSLGPGLTTGAADDDPSGITTYSQTGAVYGFQLLWLSVFTFPLMAVIQEMCARIGLVTGRGLAGTIRIYYPRWVLYLCTILLFAANTLNLGADLGAMVKVTQLLFPDFSFSLIMIGFTILTLGLQIFTSYAQYARYLKWLALILVSYVLSAMLVDLDLKQIFFSTVIPSMSFSKDQIFLICAILGTTISPYLFFWQTSQEVEEEILKGRTTVKLRQEEVTKEELSIMRTDVWSGMFVSNLVMFFIIAACAATLNANGITDIKTTEDAALALKPLAGDKAYVLFALGVIGTGLLAIPILAGSASYALSEAFRWKFGLYRKLKEAPSFYGVIIISTLIGFFMNLVGVDVIKVLLYSAVFNGMVAPVILVLIVLISSNRKIMGNQVNSPFVEFLGWLVTFLMIIAGGAVIVSLFI